MPLLRDSSIRRKLSMVAFLTSLLGLSIAGVAFEMYERASFRTGVVDGLTADADMLSLNSAASLAFNDLKSEQDLLQAFRVERNIVAACVYGKRGKLFAEYRRDSSGPACE